MFIWARFPHIDDSLAFAETSQRDGIMLAPGTVFRPHLERSPWLRFNVAVCDDKRVQDRLQWLASSAAA
jgi:DNA-binding transcriptional MocR family regulator